MSRHGFLHGAMVLALAGVLSRILGVFYVIVLPRVLQSEGYGLYTAVKPVYHTMLILAIAGLPVAIAKLVADRYAVGDLRGLQHVFTLSVKAMAVTGLFAGVTLAVAAEPLARILRVPEAAPLLRVVAPAALIMALTSALRGCFQGLQRMMPIALSQIAEQIVRVVSTICLAVALAPLGQVYGAAGAMLGGVLGGAGALLILCFTWLWQRRRIQAELAQRARKKAVRAGGGTLRQLLSLALPLVLGQILWPIIEFLDTTLVPQQLMTLGFSRAEAMAQLGYLGMAGQLMWLPTILTLALAASLMPAVAKAWALRQVRQVRRLTHEALRVAILFGLPAGMGLFVLADGCAWLLFGFSEAGAPLAVLAFGTLMLGIQQVTAGTLQGLGKVHVPIMNLLLGAAIKFGMNWWLVATPWGSQGAAGGTLVGFTTAACLNYLAIRRIVGASGGLRAWLFKPVTATLIMGAVVRLTYAGLLLALETAVLRRHWALTPFTVNAAATLAAIAVGVLTYGLALLRLGGLRRKDIDAIPLIGARLNYRLARLGWVA
ncbi:MAG TPA: polysaccharide biosynthesis protein [Firmicutes bacterium]|jgi:stage V sporulation protein B|nr:polysaccharide biosynthesis protein [Bacillota bacterium]